MALLFLSPRFLIGELVGRQLQLGPAIYDIRQVDLTNVEISLRIIERNRILLYVWWPERGKWFPSTGSDSCSSFPTLITEELARIKAAWLITIRPMLEMPLGSNLISYIARAI